MLTPKELEIVEELCSSLSDVKRKKALNNLLFEYRQYMRCGSPEECAQRKEWMQMSYEDIRENFNNTVKHYKERFLIFGSHMLIQNQLRKSR